MEVATARQILGVSAADGWEVVRATYRARIRESHPDLAGSAGVARTVELNAAYRTLSVAKREGRLHDAPEPTSPTEPAPASGPARHAARPQWTPPRGAPPDVRLLSNDTLVLASTPDETFRRLVEATHEIGEISYLDRSSAIFEAILELDDGTHASFVVSLQWRAHDASCEAFCTLEALEHPEHLDVSGVLEQLLPYIPLDRMR